MNDAAPLEGLRIVEISSFVAAPLGGMTLAQLGAEVIRVDPLGGAADRGRWPLAPSGDSLFWAGLNKGKRSVTVDLRAPEGRAIVSRLAAECGILLTNGPTVDLAPNVISVRIEGRHDGSPAVDYTVNAEVGFPLVTGPADAEGPVNHVLPAWDVACGLYAAVGILAAVRHQARTGQARSVRLALHDVALAVAGSLGFLAEASLGGVARPRIGNHLYGAFARDFATADDRRVMVVTLTHRHLTALAGATGVTERLAALEELLGADFRTDGDRYRHREALAALVEPWFAARPLAEITAALKGVAVLWSAYRTFAEVAASPELRANPLMGLVDQPGIGSYLAPGSPLRFGQDPPPGPAPLLGADTPAVLCELLDLTPGQVADLAGRGIVGGAR